MKKVLLANREMKRSVRRNLIVVLEALAAGVTTQSLGKATPYLDSLTELQCLWFDDLYPGKFECDGVFSKEEISAMEPLSDALRALAATGLADNIGGYQTDARWQSVITAARRARARLAA